ncbi:MAG: hypothetical protein AMXMBFR7_44030 [Planctomycetota bacterium]
MARKHPKKPLTLGHGRHERVSKTLPSTSRTEPALAVKGRGRLASLTGVSEALGADLAPKKALQMILEAAHRTTRASSASLMLIQPGTDILQVKVAEGFHSDSIFKTRLRVGQGVTGWVAETGVPLRIGNVSKDTRYVRVQKGLRSEMAVPLKLRGQVIGVISVDSTRLNHFSAEDEELLVSLAAHSARLIESTRRLVLARRRTKELQFLTRAGHELAASLNQQQVLETLASMTAEQLRAPLAAVFLLNKEGTGLELGAAAGRLANERDWPEFPVADSLLSRGFENPAEVLDFPDLSFEGSGDAARSAFLTAGFAAAAVVPLSAQKKPMGVLLVLRRKQRALGSEKRRVLAGLAATGSLALENACVHRRMLETEEQLRKSEKSSLLVELAGALSHEIRNPLTSLKILFESLTGSQSWTEDQLEDQQMMRRQIERLEQIVESYLESSRAHATIREPKPLDLNAVIDESLLLLATSAHEGTRLMCELAEGELPTTGDPMQLSQAVYNLVLNALQAVAQLNPNGRGRVEIRSGRVDRNGVPDESRIFFEVADDGPGLAPEVQAHLFEPFVTTKREGVGLGLSIVKRIVLAHGGELTVESPRKDLGRGVRFRVTLPGRERALA